MQIWKGLLVNTHRNTPKKLLSYAYIQPQLILVMLKFSHSQCPSTAATAAPPARPNDDVPCRRKTGWKHTNFGHSNNQSAVRLVVVESHSFFCRNILYVRRVNKTEFKLQTFLRMCNCCLEIARSSESKQIFFLSNTTSITVYLTHI